MKRTLALILTLALALGMTAGIGYAAEEATDWAALYGDGFTEEVTLNVAMMWPLDSTTDAKSYALNNALARLKEDYPNITINYDGSVHDDYQTIMMTYSAADSLPDVFNVKGSWLKNLIDSEQIGTMDEFFEYDPEWFEALNDGALFDMQYGDHYYGSPFQNLACTLIVYNKDIYASVGYDSFPETWDEMIECFTALKAAGYTPLGMGNSGQWVANSCLFGVLAYLGAGEQWYHDIMDGTGDGFLDANMLAGVEKMAELSELGFFNDNMNSIDQFEVMPPYLREEYASYIDGSWTFGTLIATAGDDQSIVEKSGVAVFPKFEGGLGEYPSGSLGSGWGQAYRTGLTDAQKYAAYLLIKYTTDAEWTYDVTSKGDMGGTDIEYDYSQSSPVVQNFIALRDTLTPAPLYDCHFDTGVIDVMNTGFQELLIGQITAQQWGENCQKEYESTLE